VYFVFFKDSRKSIFFFYIENNKCYLFFCYLQKLINKLTLNKSEYGRINQKWVIICISLSAVDSSIIGSSLFSVAFILFLQHFSLLQQCSFDTIFLSYGSRDRNHMGRNSQVRRILGKKLGLLFWITLTTAINTINTTTSPNTTQNGILARKKMNIVKKIILCCLKINAVNLQSGH